MIHRIVIPGRLPGLNEYSDAERSNRYKAAKLKGETEELIMLVIRSQLRGVTIESPVHMRYLWIEPNRKRDKDNIASAKKFVQDALVKSHVLKGDGWKYIIGFSDSFDVDKNKPRIEVEIEER